MKTRSPLPPAAWWLGAVSFLNDAASEMVLPLLPSLITGAIGAPAATLGAIEGTATAVASVLKLIGGRIADRTGKHGALVIGGYTASNLVRPLMALVNTAGGVLALRILDRVGKGLRTAPRDALLAAATPADAQAAAFSVHRALDHAGTILGALAAVYLIHWLGFTSAEVFAWSAVPGVLVVVLAIVAVRAANADMPRAKAGVAAHAARVAASRPPAEPAPTTPLPGRLYALLALVALSRLGLASELFLLLFAGRFVPLWAVPLLWAGLHLVKSASAFAAVPLGSRLGAHAMVVLGWTAHALVFAGFAFAALRWDAVFAASAMATAGGAVTRSMPASEGPYVAVVGLFGAWGLYAGLSEGAEKALVSARSGPEAKGTAFGAYHMVAGLMALPASVGFGWLWDAVAPAAAFGAGSLCAAIAVGFLLLFG